MYITSMYIKEIKMNSYKGFHRKNTPKCVLMDSDDDIAFNAEFDVFSVCGCDVNEFLGNLSWVVF